MMRLIYIVKLGFAWVYIIILIFASNIDCESLLESNNVSLERK